MRTLSSVSSRDILELQHQQAAHSIRRYDALPDLHEIGHQLYSLQAHLAMHAVRQELTHGSAGLRTQARICCSHARYYALQDI